jgi:hypothetical protein
MHAVSLEKQACIMTPPLLLLAQRCVPGNAVVRQRPAILQHDWPTLTSKTVRVERQRGLVVVCVVFLVLWRNSDGPVNTKLRWWCDLQSRWLHANCAPNLTRQKDAPIMHTHLYLSADRLDRLRPCHPDRELLCVAVHDEDLHLFEALARNFAHVVAVFLRVDSASQTGASTEGEILLLIDGTVTRNITQPTAENCDKTGHGRAGETLHTGPTMLMNHGLNSSKSTSPVLS